MDPTIMLLSFRLAAVERQQLADDARRARQLRNDRWRDRIARVRAASALRLRGAQLASEPACCTA